MKKIASLFAVLFLFVFIPMSHPSDQVSMDTIVITQPATNSPTDSFGIVVTKNNKLTTKPGPVFTEGTDTEGAALPYLLSNPKPISYPKWAIHNGWQGECTIAVEILADGSVGRYYVMRSTGHETLDEEAVKALKSWKFHPATKDGRPFVTCIQIPITFQLQDE